MTSLYNKYWIVADTEQKAIDTVLAVQATNNDINLYVDNKWRCFGTNHGLIISGYSETATPAITTEDGMSIITPATQKPGWRALLKVRPEFNVYIDAAKVAGLIETYEPDKFSPFFA